MCILFKFKLSHYYELHIGYENEYFSSMYGLCLIKWVVDTDQPYYNEDREYPVIMFKWFKHPKYWFK
jgi:hypothetical protein